MRLICTFAVFFYLSSPVEAKIHSAPIIVQGFKVRHVTRYPIKTYRLFRSDEKGNATAIPFQIDELNDYGDYVLDQGGQVTKNDGNGIFDLQDELVYMGDDVGPAVSPKVWPEGKKPTIFYELKHQYIGNEDLEYKTGAVYIGIYFGDAPALSSKNYVSFNKAANEVNTARYNYQFDPANYLVVKGIGMKSGDKGSAIPLIESSTFYLKADLKYFLTFEINHRDINSYLEAYKMGPIRTIVRVTFFYKFLKINFELGMYTEVSLFSNSVILPAIMYNPLDGANSLNDGSGFYYGFAVSENLSSYQIDTNIPTYQIEKGSLFDFFKDKPKTASSYWLSMEKQDRMMFFEITPSQEMLNLGNIPMLYQESIDGKTLATKRSNDGAKPLGKSPVNLGLYFNLTKFKEGEHRISFRLFFDNVNNPKEMLAYKTLSKWDLLLNRM